MKFICTFTGVDTSTNFLDLVAISRKFPFVEWGVLFSFDRMGNENKYPPYDWMHAFADDAQKYNLNTALHLCGRSARVFLEHTPKDKMEAIKIESLANKFGRIQVNFKDLSDFRKYIPHPGISIVNKAKEINKPIIMQYNSINEAQVMIAEPSINKNVHILVDYSGGEGVYNSQFFIPVNCENASIAHAGGLGPDTIQTAFPQIVDLIFSANVEGHCDNPQFGIDMEGRIRTNDLLDIAKLTNVAEYVDDYLFKQGRLSYG
jgi:hypothetical protein